MEVCIVDGCEKEAIFKGFCGSCCVHREGLVISGEATWEQLRKKAKRIRKIRSVFKERRSKKRKIIDGYCMTNGCKDLVVSHGVCEKCFYSLREYVRSGLMTWETLIEKHKILATETPIAVRGNGSGIRCLTEGCPNESYKRGVCVSCYNKYTRWVKRNFSTWEILEESGKVLLKKPPFRKGRKTSQKKGSGLKCITEGCDRESISRGVCGTCYEMYRHRVSKEYCTWDALVAEGKILPASKRGKKPKPPDPWKGARESFDSACL